jgi:hypothetical protein
MTQKKKDLTFEENHAKLYADMINYEEQVNMGMMDEAIKETVKEKDFKKTNLKEYASRKKQVGGNHYKMFKIQPVEFIMGNNLTFLEGNVIKYTTRARYKNGIEDYEKAKHCLELMIEHIKENGHNE